MVIIDMHTHILPGVDDGARDWDIALEMLKLCAESGVQKIIATPHCVPWKKKQDCKKIRELCHEAEKKLLSKHGIHMDIYPGNEIYYSLDVVSQLKDGEVLTLAGSRYVLVEFGTKESYQVFCRAVKEFIDGGYIPIIAHIERYGSLHQLERLRELKEMGALLQMNVEAFQGGILSEGARWSKKCLSNQMIDFLGSDMHNLSERAPLKKNQLHWVQNKLEHRYLQKLLYGNAQKVVDDIRI